MYGITAILYSAAGGALLAGAGVFLYLRWRKNRKPAVFMELSLEHVLAAVLQAKKKVKPGQKLFAVDVELSKFSSSILPTEKLNGAGKAILIVITDESGIPLSVESLLLAEHLAPDIANQLQEGGGAIEFVS